MGRLHLPPARRLPSLEELEPRILFSADLAAGVLAPGHWDGPAEVRLLDAPGEASLQAGRNSVQATRTHEIVFVDTDISDYGRLVEDLVRQNSDSRQIEIILLDSSRGGVDQISQALQGQQGIDALHLVAHGMDGFVGLGGGALDMDTVNQRADQIRAWGNALAADGDLLIYGCDVAATADGRAMLDRLSGLTGADVAASDDLTGTAALGADWNLEYQRGTVETGVAFSAAFQSEWLGTLLVHEQFTNYSGEQQIKSTVERGQTFQHTGGSGTYTVNEIILAMRRDSDTPDQNITVTLRDSWDGNILGSATIASGGLGTSLGFTTFHLPDVTLDDGTTYTIQITTDSTAGKIYVGYNPSGTYPGGAHLNSSGHPQSGQDLAFQVGYNNLPGGLPAVTGAAAEDQTLGVDTSALADADGLGTFGYQWLRGGAAIAGATGVTYTLGDADVGQAISVRVSYMDGQGAAETLSSAPTEEVANINDAPGGQPAVTGAAAKGQTLEVDTATLADADGLGAFGYQWLRGGAAIAGATEATYTLGYADVGQAISVRVSYTDGQGTAETMTSAPTGAVANISDAPGGQPVVTGKPAEVSNTVPMAVSPPREGSVTSTSTEATAGTSPSPVSQPATIQRTVAPGLVAVDHGISPAPNPVPGPMDGQGAAGAQIRQPILQTPTLGKGVSAGTVYRSGVFEISQDVAETQYFFRLTSLNPGEMAQGQPGREPDVLDLGADPDKGDQTAEYEFSMHTGQVIGITLTAGAVLWSMRVSGLLVGMLAAVPAWRQLDLLPILPNEDEEQWGQDDNEEALRDEASVSDVLAHQRHEVPW